MKLKELTAEQTSQIEVYRKRYFEQATSTAPADRARAEAAARRLAEIGGVKVNDVTWVLTPEMGMREYEEAQTSLKDSLKASLSASLSDSLRASLWDSLKDSLRASLSASLSDSLRASLWDSLWNSLRASLSDSLRASLWDSLWNSLRASLSDSLRASLWDSLWYSLWYSLWDSDWLCWYSYAVDVLGIECSDEHRELLSLHNKVATSCFAMWIIPGKVILCERPESVKIDDGRLVELTWRTSQ